MANESRKVVSVEIRQIAQQIRTNCVSGRESGFRLPPATALASELGVSRYTIRAALNHLTALNVIESRKGAGVVVATGLEDRYKKFVGKQVAVVFGKSWLALKDTFTQALLMGMYNGIYNTGLNILMTSQNWGHRSRESPAFHLGGPGVAGVILIGRQSRSVLDSLKKLKRKPIISVDCDATSEGIHSVCCDNISASNLLAKRLHKLGHRRVMAVLESPERAKSARDPAWDERTQAFLAMWKKLNNPEPEFIYLNDRGFLAMEQTRICRLFRSPPNRRPTAVFAMAHDALLKKFATDCGLEIPRDLSIVSFSNGFPSDDATASTSVWFNGQELGGTALKLILNQILNPKLRKHQPHLTRIKGKYVSGSSHARALEK